MREEESPKYLREEDHCRGALISVDTKVWVEDRYQESLVFAELPVREVDRSRRCLVVAETFVREEDCFHKSLGSRRSTCAVSRSLPADLGSILGAGKKRKPPADPSAGASGFTAIASHRYNTTLPPCLTQSLADQHTSGHPEEALCVQIHYSHSNPSHPTLRFKRSPALHHR